MARIKYKPGHLVIQHEGYDTESFPLVGHPCFMKIPNEDAIAIELGTDWVDFEESELIGGSETIAKIWGLSVSQKDLKQGKSKPIQPEVKDDHPLDGGVFAWFFGSVGRRVDAVTVTLCGKNRVKIRMDVEDLTEETDDYSTILTFDATLTECEDEIDCPF